MAPRAAARLQLASFSRALRGSATLPKRLASPKTPTVESSSSSDFSCAARVCCTSFFDGALGCFLGAVGAAPPSALAAARRSRFCSLAAFLSFGGAFGGASRGTFASAMVEKSGGDDHGDRRKLSRACTWWHIYQRLYYTCPASRTSNTWGDGCIRQACYSTSTVAPPVPGADARCVPHCV